MPSLLTPQQISYLKIPDITIAECEQRWPGERTGEAWGRAIRRYRSERTVPLHVKANDPAVSWDKHIPEFDWREYVAVYAQAQSLHKRSSGEQNKAHIRITSPTGVPIGFISDFHFGSWATSMLRIREVTDQIQRLGIRLAVLGDMMQMSIRLRGVLEMSDNMMTPREQTQFLDAWLNELSSQFLWFTWCNHVVQRQEDAIGYSPTAEMVQKHGVYHQGIGHIDLEITDGEGQSETYKIASSHKFRGNTSANPLAGSIKYMRTVGIDREVTIAGDSHVPEYRAYVDGPLPRLAINCGSLQEDSDYAARYFTPYSHDFMPVVVFYPDEHRMIPYRDLTDYERRAE